ncbi:MAG: TlyA family RNA methyltransferase [Anaerolineaceae bacterium]|nr:TlyA family RNA methyltransferase [Anaerolineaceae bacterium]
MKKERIDILMVKMGLVESRNKAQRMIMAGEISANGQKVHKPSEKFALSSEISIAAKPKYISRGGLKLEKALKEFSIDVKGKICVDIGASTGGFTDCLLQNGAVRVYAIDVGYGQLHQSLRGNSAVINMERTNIKDVSTLREKIDLITIDVSFISLKKIFPIMKKWTNDKKIDIIVLIKPQFEVGRKIAAKGKGVIRNEKDRQQAVNNVLSAAQREGFEFHGITESPIKGPKGNVEYLAFFSFFPLPVK